MKAKLLFVIVLFMSSILMECMGQTASQNTGSLLYLKNGDPANWTTPNTPSSQYKEITIWEGYGYSVITENLEDIELTEVLLNNYETVRINGQYGGAFLTSEVEAVENWVNNGGDLFLEIPRTESVNITQPFEVQGIEGENGGTNGLNWYYHGAPWNFGPVIGPFSSVNQMASQVMDHPILASNHNLIIDCEVDGYPVIVHKEFGLGKVVIIFTEGWSQDMAPTGNLYKANIYEAENIAFLENVIIYFNSSTSIQDYKYSAILHAYPNPVYDIVNIILPKEFIYGEISIYDIAGRKVLAQITSEEYIQTNISHLQAGLYIINLTKDGNVGTAKIIKK